MIDTIFSCFLATRDNAAMNVYIQFFCVWMPIFISVGHIAGSEIVGSYGNSMLNLLKNCQYFLKQFAPFYILTNNVLVFQFRHILAAICYFLFCIVTSVHFE